MSTACVIHEDVTVINAIKNACITIDAVYTPQLVDEFHTWRSTNDISEYRTYSLNPKERIPYSLPKLADYWVRNLSTTIIDQQNQKEYFKCINNYCKRNNIPYTDDLLVQFNAWMTDPVNKRHITRVVGRDAYSAVMDLEPRTCVNRWFKTIIQVVLNN